MNGTRTLFAVVLSLLLVLSALPAAAVSFNSIWSVNRINTGGETSKKMTPSNTTFCYLSKVGVENTDTTGEMATCQIILDDGYWVLQAVLERSDDADVECSAICYNNY